MVSVGLTVLIARGDEHTCGGLNENTRVGQFYVSLIQARVTLN